MSLSGNEGEPRTPRNGANQSEKHKRLKEWIEDSDWPPLQKALAHSGNNAYFEGEFQRIPILRDLWVAFGFKERDSRAKGRGLLS